MSYVESHFLKFAIDLDGTHMPVYHCHKPVIQRLLQVTTPKEYSKNVNFDFFYSLNLQGLIPVKNALISQVGVFGDIFLWLVANLKQWPFT